MSKRRKQKDEKKGMLGKKRSADIKKIKPGEITKKDIETLQGIGIKESKISRRILKNALAHTMNPILLNFKKELKIGLPEKMTEQQHVRGGAAKFFLEMGLMKYKLAQTPMPERAILESLYTAAGAVIQPQKLEEILLKRNVNKRDANLAINDLMRITANLVHADYNLAAYKLSKKKISELRKSKEEGAKNVATTVISGMGINLEQVDKFASSFKQIKKLVSQAQKRQTQLIVEMARRQRVEKIEKLKNEVAEIYKKFRKIEGEQEDIFHKKGKHTSMQYV